MSPNPNQGALFRRGTLLLPPLLLLVLLFVFKGWNVVWGDGVSMCPIFDKLYRSTLTFGDLWAPYQGHRLLVHRSVELLLGWATHWNINAEIGLIYLSLLCDYLLLCWLLQDLRPAISERAWFVLATIISWSVFSASQEETWTNGFNMASALSVTYVLAGVVCLAKFGASFRALLFCILMGTGACYSFGNGLTYWGALVPLLYVKLRGDPRRAVKSLLWAGAAGAVVTLYFRGLGGSGGSMTFGQSVFNISRMPGAFFSYLLACAGGGIFFLNGAKAGLPAAVRSLIACGAPVCGLIGLTAFGWTIWRLWRRGGQTFTLIAPWLTLGLYAVFSVGVTTVARYGFPLESAIASRYIIFSQYLWLALFVSLAVLAPRVRRGWVLGTGSVLVLCYLLSYANGVRRDRTISAELRRMRTELLGEPTVQTYLLINGDRDPAQVASFMAMTREHRLAMFHDAAP